jgi:hypothetical protein
MNAWCFTKDYLVIAAAVLGKEEGQPAARVGYITPVSPLLLMPRSVMYSPDV